MKTKAIALSVALFLNINCFAGQNDENNVLKALAGLTIVGIGLSILCLNTDNDHQPEPVDKSKQEEIPDGITLEDYLTQLQYDLRTVPQKNINEITSNARKELHSLWQHQIKNKNKVNSIIGKAILDVSDNKVRAVSKRHTSDYYKIKQIVDEYHKRVQNILDNSSSPNGSRLSFVFGPDLENEIRAKLGSGSHSQYANQQSSLYQNYSSSTQQTTYQPNIQTGTSSYHQEEEPSFINTYLDGLNRELSKTQSVLSYNEIATIINKVRNGLSALPDGLSALPVYQQEQKAKEYAKSALLELFETHLKKYEQELRRVIINSSKLDDAIIETRNYLVAQITNSTKIDGNKANQWFGDNLKETVLDNISDINCDSECGGYYRQEHRHGTVDRVVLKNCGHTQCSKCIKKWQKSRQEKSYPFNCPICRADIDIANLDQQIHQHATGPQPSAPAWDI